MPHNLRFSLRTLLTVLAVGLITVSTHAQTSGVRVASQFGLHRPGQASQAALPNLQPNAIPQSSSTLIFGLIDFPCSPDSTAFGINKRGDIVGGYGPMPPAEPRWIIPALPTRSSPESTIKARSLGAMGQGASPGRQPTFFFLIRERLHPSPCPWAIFSSRFLTS